MTVKKLLFTTKQEKMEQSLIDLLINTNYSWAANHTIVEFLAGYVFAAALIVGAPSVFLLIAFMPALMNTKGAVVGYKIHRDYGDTSIYSKLN